MALKDLFSKKSAPAETAAADETQAEVFEQEPVLSYEQQLEQLERTGIYDISGVSLTVGTHAPVSAESEQFGDIVEEVIAETAPATVVDVVITTGENDNVVTDDQSASVEDTAVDLSFDAVGVAPVTAEEEPDLSVESVTSDEPVSDEEIPDIVEEELVSEEPTDFVEDSAPVEDVPTDLDSVEEEIPVVPETISDFEDESVDELTEQPIISDTDDNSSAISDVNKNEEVADMADVNKMLDSEMADYVGYDKTSSANIKENVIVPDKLVIPDEGSTEPASVIEEEVAPAPAPVVEETSAPDTAPVEPIPVAEPAPAATAAEPVSDIYTDNAKLIMLLRKMGILDAVESLAAGNEIPTAELLRATAPIQRLSASYGEAESLAATYLESRGINFKKLAGDKYTEYSAVQILFIGNKVLNKFAHIEAILNPMFSISQMDCICELEDSGVNTDWCKPTMSPSVMRALADLYKLNYDMSIIDKFDTLTWHGVTLIMMAERMGFTDIEQFITGDTVKTLNENELYNKLNGLTKDYDSKQAELCSNGIEYTF